MIASLGGVRHSRIVRTGNMQKGVVVFTRPRRVAVRYVDRMFLDPYRRDIQYSCTPHGAGRRTRADDAREVYLRALRKHDVLRDMRIGEYDASRVYDDTTSGDRP